MRRIAALVWRVLAAAVVVTTSTVSVGTAGPAGGKFDGTWQAKAVPTGAGQCRGLTREAKIANDKFSLLWNSRSSIYVTGAVDDTGTLPISGGTVGNVSGTLKYDGDKFVGDVKDLSSQSYCAFNIEVIKK